MANSIRDNAGPSLYSVPDPGRGDQVGGGVADVFISYAREDLSFVRRLHDAMGRRDIETWVDWESIPPSAAWMREVEAAIESTDSFVLILSPDSVHSQTCRAEVTHATHYNKRLIPIVYRPVDDAEIPDSVRAYNWIFCREQDEFDRAIDALVSALETDLDWVHSHTHLLTRSIEWDTSGRESSFTLRGRELVAAERWLDAAGEDRKPRPSALQREYVAASRATARRARRVRIGAVTTAVTIAFVLSIVAYLYYNSSQHATSTADVTQARRLADFSTASLDTDPELSLLLARSAVARARIPETQASLVTALERSRVRVRLDVPQRVNSVGISPDGRLLLSAGSDGTVRIWDRRNAGRRGPIAVLRAGTAPVNSAAFSPDGRRLVTAAADGTARVWSTGHPQKPLFILRGHSGAVYDAQFSGDGNQIVTAGADGTFRVWNGAPAIGTCAPDPAAQLGACHPGATYESPDGPVRSAAFDPHGPYVVTTGGPSARSWDLRTSPPTPIAALKPKGLEAAGVPYRSTGASFSADGRSLVVVFVAVLPDGSVIDNGESDVFTMRTQACDRCDETALGTILGTSTGFLSRGLSATLSADGSLAATSGSNGAIEVDRTPVNGALPQPVVTLRGHHGAVNAVAFDPTNDALVSGGDDRTVRIWQFDDVTRVLRLPTAIANAYIAPDARHAVTTSQSGRLGPTDELDQWALTSTARAPAPTLLARTPDLIVATTPDAHRFAVVDLAGSPRPQDASPSPVYQLEVRSTTGQRQIGVVRGVGPVSGVFSQDGSTLAVDNGGVEVWRIDAHHAATQAKLANRESLAIDARGQYLATLDLSPKGRLEVWDISRRNKPKRIYRLPTSVTGQGFANGVLSATLSADGTRLAAAVLSNHFQSQTAYVYDLTSRHLQAFAGLENPIALSADGRFVAGVVMTTTDPQPIVEVRDAVTGAFVSALDDPYGDASLRFGASGTGIIASSTQANTAALLNCSECRQPGALDTIARERSTRGYTTDERRRYQLG